VNRLAAVRFAKRRSLYRADRARCSPSDYRQK
jgi:hypothetical protein